MSARREEHEAKHFELTEAAGEARVYLKRTYSFKPKEYLYCTVGEEVGAVVETAKSRRRALGAATGAGIGALGDAAGGVGALGAAAGAGAGALGADGALGDAAGESSLSSLFTIPEMYVSLSTPVTGRAAFTLVSKALPTPRVVCIESANSQEYMPTLTMSISMSNLTVHVYTARLRVRGWEASLVPVSRRPET